MNAPQIVGIRSLYEHEREECYDWARKKVAGPEIDTTKIQSELPGKFPRWIVSIIYILCIVLLVSAFIPSAVRIQKGASSAFCDGMKSTESETLSAGDRRICTIVGWTAVGGAEIGQIIFFYALAVLGVGSLTRRIFWFGAISATVFALVGNVEVANPTHNFTLFKGLEAIYPTMIVMGIGYVLKELSLTSIESRQQLLAKMRERQEEREALLDNPEASPTWNRIYTRALREGLRRANSRKRDVLEQLTHDQWVQLIRNEMLASKWEVTPTLPSPPIPARTEPATELPPVSPTPSLIADGEVWQTEKGTWAARSNRTGTFLGDDYVKQHHAHGALRSHHRALDRRS